MLKTSKDDFYVLSAVSIPESSVPQANLDSERSMLSSSQSFTIPLNFFYDHLESRKYKAHNSDSTVEELGKN